MTTFQEHGTNLCKIKRKKGVAQNMDTHIHVSYKEYKIQNE